MFALTAVGVDRPGIIAAIAKPLAAHNINVTDSEMAILQGHFAMMLIVNLPDGSGVSKLKEELQEVGTSLDLEFISLRELGQITDSSRVLPTFLLSIYGADHPGILSAITDALAEGEINVCDLSTRVVGDDHGKPLYVMLIEVVTARDMKKQQLQDLLKEPAELEGVDVAVQPIEHDVL